MYICMYIYIYAHTAGEAVAGDACGARQRAGARAQAALRRAPQVRAGALPGLEEGT